MEGLNLIRLELIECNNRGTSWTAMAREIGCAPGTVLRFIDEWGPAGPHMRTAQKMADYCGFELAFTRSKRNRTNLRSIK